MGEHRNSAQLPPWEIVGLEVTAFEAPEDERERAIRTALVASIVGALLPA